MNEAILIPGCIHQLLLISPKARLNSTASSYTLLQHNICIVRALLVNVLFHHISKILVTFKASNKVTICFQLAHRLCLWSLSDSNRCGYPTWVESWPLDEVTLKLCHRTFTYEWGHLSYCNPSPYTVYPPDNSRLSSAT